MWGKKKLKSLDRREGMLVLVRLVAPGADGGGVGDCGMWVTAVVVVVGGDDGCDNADSSNSRRS